MPPKALPTDYPVYSFPSAAEFEAFLDHEHLNLPGFYLNLAKKASGIQSITKQEATEVVLCFGWIDGWGYSIDDKRYVVRYTPRRSKSIWSKINTDTVDRLTKEGRMRPAGLASVEAAKADGRWDRAYSAPSNITVPDDLAAALRSQPAAAAFFDSLNKSNRYAVLWRLETGSPKTREKRIKATVQSLAAGQMPGSGTTTKSKTTSTITKKPVPAAMSKAVKAKPQKPLSKTEKHTATDQPRRAGLRSRSC